MSDIAHSSPSPSKRAGQPSTRCPHCHKTYAVHAEHAGRKVLCKGCGQEFMITVAEKREAGSGHSGGVPDTGVPAALACPICQSPIGEEKGGNPVTQCEACHTAHHKDCWEYNRGCGLYGCAQAPETEKLQDVEIPASYWGQTQKACPSCGKVIQAAAVRCRHCGATFESARPQEAGEFQSAQVKKQAQSTHKTIGIIVLIAAVIPCTAPLAAVGGVIWYLAARKAIAALPPLQATICRLGVGIAVVMTVLFTIIGAAYAHFS